MKKSTRYSAALALLVALGLLAGCSQSASDANTSSQEDALSGQQTAATAMDTSALFSDRDLEGSTITITAEGVYLLSGTLTDGQIVVNAGETDKVQLVLKGADITSSTSAQPGGHGGWSKGTPPRRPRHPDRRYSGSSGPDHSGPDRNHPNRNHPDRNGHHRLHQPKGHQGRGRPGGQRRRVYHGHGG